jgi:hypothetical protein
MDLTRVVVGVGAWCAKLSGNPNSSRIRFMLTNTDSATNLKQNPPSSPEYERMRNVICAEGGFMLTNTDSATNLKQNPPSPTRI